jgi:glycerophosphoryl diester phosphodiesterase
MRVISHRGLWYSPQEKNTTEAFRQSFKLGFGTETDVRDYNGQLVISHDIPNGSEILLTTFLEEYLAYASDLPLALNIKSDGLQKPFKRAMEDYKINNYFVFDMSVPDAFQYKNAGIKFFSRLSEYEHVDMILPGSDGVWLDAFYDDWFDVALIHTLIGKGLNVAIVSSELHARDYTEQWEKLKKANFDERVIICTDLPEKAREFFR